ncbi:hypothetical protein EJB05_34688 [Eragrostis curvula]|uniref:Uncharacterized protein n=1 Tax=Eragrostis curvula TaxID=38414 RepID=A0A5J9U611_9POAL|nr:hypothetical protein EJB05_34688 [Eragrostis curvula]
MLVVLGRPRHREHADTMLRGHPWWRLRFNQARRRKTDDRCVHELTSVKDTFPVYERSICYQNGPWLSFVTRKYSMPNPGLFMISMDSMDRDMSHGVWYFNVQHEVDYVRSI